MMMTDEIELFGQEYAFRLNHVTLNLYKRFTVELIGHSGKRFDEINTRDIRKWLGDLSTDGLAISTLNTRIAGIKLFYRFCSEEGLVELDPTKSIHLSKVEEKLPYYLTREQLSNLRSTAKGLRERAVIETLFFTGLRISELVAMKKEDINWLERSIHIPKGKRKKARIVLFSRECGETLKAYLDSRTDDLPFIFLNSYGTRQASKRTIQFEFKAYGETLGIVLTPHTLRHTFAAQLAIKGMPLACIQILLGHEDQNQTRHYARLYDHARKSIYDEWM